MLSLLYNCFASWQIQPATVRELQNADVIFALSFGCRQGLPNLSNDMLARITDRLHEAYDIPIIAQHEIAALLSYAPMYVIRNHRTSSQYLDTFEVCDQFSLLCIQHGFEEVIIVAHPDHQWRAMQTTARLELKPLAADCRFTPYDPSSDQWWTKGRYRFMIREVPARLFYAWKGKL